jgi:hypothetical protein
MLSKEQLEAAHLTSVEDTSVGVIIKAANGEKLFLTDEVLAQIAEAVNRRGKQEYAILTNGDVIDTVWAKDGTEAAEEAAERMRSDGMGDVDFEVWLKSK